MRTNLPVSQREYILRDGETLMSTTDTKGRITFVNSVFLEVSGYEEEELIGSPHNLVRHPDMPEAAFADMWKTIQAGDTWTALVKNRRKNGDHYWVRANVTPMRQNGNVVGYMSVRTKPTRDEVEAAERLYAAMRDGTARGVAIHKGLVVRTGLRAWQSWGQRMPLSLRLWAPVLAAAAVPTIAALMAGLPMGAALATLASGIVAALAAGIWLRVQVGSPMALALEQVKAIASGAPAACAGLDRVDEMGFLLRGINQSGLNLASLVTDVSRQVGSLTGAASEIAAANHDLSSRTEQQASSLEQTAASMEQFGSTVRESAFNAGKASELATHSSEIANRGGEAVRQVVANMNEIRDSSKKISEIIGVIDGIAFQTNLLALNAAVEAARAGEQGRGFAVVANEVRNLAHRSADASREIRSLILASGERVEAGVELVSQAGETINDVVISVGKVTQLMIEISASSNEQSAGIEQVNQAVGHLDQMTQQNAAMVEQGTASASALSDQARKLSQAVGVYRLSDRRLALAA